MASKSNSFASLAEFGFWFLIFVHLMFCPHSANFVLGVFRSLFFQNGCQSGDYSKSFLVRIFLRWRPVCGNPNLVPSDFSVNGLQDSSRLNEISGTLQITWYKTIWRPVGGNPNLVLSGFSFNGFQDSCRSTETSCLLAADHLIARFKTKWWPNKRMGRSGYEKAKKDNGLTMTSIYKAKEGNTSTKQ